MSSGRSASRSPKTRPAAEIWSAPADLPLQTLLDRPDTPPLLAHAVRAIPWQTRNIAPVGRVVASPRTAPQALAALLALGGSAVADSAAAAAPVSIEDLLAGGPDVARLEIPLTPAGHAWGSASVARTPADSPIVAAFAVVEVANDTVEQARIALTGVWPEPARLAEAAAQLLGRVLTKDVAAATGAAIAEECSPPDNFLGSEEYRRAMAAVTTERALAACAERIAQRSEAGS